MSTDPVTESGSSPSGAKDRVATRLREADLPADRFIDVSNSGKASTDHTQREAGAVSGNYGVYAGRGLVVIDDDTDPGAYIAGIDDLKETFTVGTPNGTPEGRDHRYYAIEDAPDVFQDEFGVYNPVADFGEVRVRNQYVVGPGSSNPDGDVRDTYKITNDAPIAEISAQALVAALRASGYGESGGNDSTDPREDTSKPQSDTSDISDDELLRKAKSAEYGEDFSALWRGDTSGYKSHSEADYHLCRHLLFWTAGDRKRTDRLFRQSGLCRDKWTNRKDYREQTLESAETAISSYYDPTESEQQGPEYVEPPEWTHQEESDSPGFLCPAKVAEYAGLEAGENETLADVIADITDREKAAIVWDLLKRSDEFHIRVYRANGELYGYDSGVWTPEGERTLRHAARQALGSTNYGTNVLTELKGQAEADPTAEVEAGTFGLEPRKIAVENGLLDLRKAANGEDDALRALEPEDYALTRLPVAYDPEAEAGEWETFVAEVVEDDKRDAFQEYVGYTLHRGEMPVNRALLLVGDGANGKSTALNTVRALLGEENTQSKAIHDFAEANHIADLHGAIANIHADLSEGALTAKGISKFKGLTGGDTMEGRRLYEDSFEFQPTAKMLFACNTTPDVSNYVDAEDSAWWRRWVVVHFPKYFPPEARDPTLERRLTSDEMLPGVLNWAIEGWARLMDNGQFTGEDATGATRKRWVTWGENVEEFIEKCVESDTDAENLSTSEAYEIYTAWCDEHGEQPIGQHEFTTTLRDAPVNVGYARRVRPRGTGTPTNGYKQLGLTDDAPEIEDVLSDDETDENTQDTRNSGISDYGGDK